MINFEDLLLGRLHRVSHVRRFSGMPLLRPETVAEHTFYVVLYCRFIATHMISLGYSVDMGKLLSRAVVHDLDESITGDVVRGVKYKDPDVKAKWDAMAREVVISLADSVQSDFLHDWESAKDDSIEGQILKLADLSSVCAYAVEEYRCGNSNMLEVLRDNAYWLQSWIDKDRASLDENIVALAEQVISITRSYPR